MADIISDITRSAETGFGSPVFSGTTRLDAGFGAPTFITSSGNDYTNVFECGFGDPFLIPNLQIQEPPPPARQIFDKLADNGGEIIKATGDFTPLRQLYRRGTGTDANENTPLGPFLVNFHQLDASGNETGVKFAAESAIPGLRNQLFTNQQQTEITFTTPVMPKASYKCKIRFAGIGPTQDLKTFEVITRLRFDKTMSIRHNLPDYWDRGEISDGYDASTGYVKGEDTAFSSMIQSWGEGFNNLYNTSYTITSQDFSLQSNGDLYVETSLGFNPAGGRLILGDGEYEYSGVARDASDNNIHYLTGVKKVVRDSGKGPRQHNLENPIILGGLEQTAPHDDILDSFTNEISLSVGPEQPYIPKGERVYHNHFDFSIIDMFYKLINTGFTKPSAILQDNFERAYNRVEYGERELMRVIFEYFYELFRQLNIKLKLKVGDIVFRKFPVELGSPDRFVVGSAFNDETYRPDTAVIYDIGNNNLNCSHVQRLCKVNNKFYFIKSRFLDNSGNMSYQLDDRGCAYWNAMTPEYAQLLEDATQTDIDIEILPWIIFKDDGGRFHIRFEKTCFDGIESFIDKDFIDFDVFISGENGEEEIGNDFNRNFNFMIMTAANIDDKVYLHKRCENKFGTYFNPNNAPEADIYVQAVRNLV